MTDRAAYQCPLSGPEVVWGEAAQAIPWDETWDRVLDDSKRPFHRWVAGGILNRWRVIRFTAPSPWDVTGS